MEEVLIVGGGPTGLALAGTLAAFGHHPRLVDRAPSPVHESRALALQARTLEVLTPLGVTGELVARGNRTARAIVHSRRVAREVSLFDMRGLDTPHPYVLFLSQAQTEEVLAARAEAGGVRVERGTELADLVPVDDHVVAVLRTPRGEERVAARYVVGCDGAHSAVRRAAGIPFAGGTYPDDFVLADLEVDGLAPGGSVHAWLAGGGLLLFFPLETPATWRLLARAEPGDLRAVTLAGLQNLADRLTGGAIRLRNPVWLTTFRVHHRSAGHYRAGPVFIAGDAAHIHSPVGGQGMNLGIQDAFDLGWKLATVLRTGRDNGLLDTYETERAPIGRGVVRWTDRAFRLANGTDLLSRLVRGHLAPVVVPFASRIRPLRTAVFQWISELGTRYRNTPLAVDGSGAPWRGPCAGERFPLDVHPAPERLGWHLLSAHPPDLSAFPAVTAHRRSEVVRARLRLRPGSDVHYLLRPDGYVGFRGSDPAALRAFLERWC